MAGKKVGSMLAISSPMFSRESPMQALRKVCSIFASASVFCFQARCYRGSNRDTRIRERKLQEKLKRRLPRQDTVFDKKAFIFQNLDKELFCFQERMGLKFNDPNYLTTAFVHPSFLAKIHRKEDIPQFASQNYSLVERLQNLKLSPDTLTLLGLTQTNLTVTSKVFSSFPFLPSIMISDISEQLSGRNIVTRLAENIGIPELLVIEEDIDQIDNEKHLPFSRADVICDAFFALMGAIYKDLGTEELQSFIDDFVMPFIDDEIFRDQIKIKQPKLIASGAAALAGYKESIESRLLFNTQNDAEVPLYVVGIFAGDRKLGEGASDMLHKAEAAAFENIIHSFMWMKE